MKPDRFNALTTFAPKPISENFLSEIRRKFQNAALTLNKRKAVVRQISLLTKDEFQQLEGQVKDSNDEIFCQNLKRFIHKDQNLTDEKSFPEITYNEKKISAACEGSPLTSIFDICYQLKSAALNEKWDNLKKLLSHYQQWLPLIPFKNVWQGINFQGADLSGVNFHNTNLDEVNFSGANLRGANLREATLYKTAFDNADLSYADLSYATFLNNTNELQTICEAKFIGADFSGVYLQDIRFQKVRYEGANFLWLNSEKDSVLPKSELTPNQFNALYEEKEEKAHGNGSGSEESKNNKEVITEAYRNFHAYIANREENKGVFFLGRLNSNPDPDKKLFIYAVGGILINPGLTLSEKNEKLTQLKKEVQSRKPSVLKHRRWGNKGHSLLSHFDTLQDDVVKQIKRHPQETPSQETQPSSPAL
jgi:Pentapeptide repeats (9 copies)